jgi:hypothetical protein
VLDFDNLQVTPILNWGGFVNRSFKISDGRSAFCLKLASNPERHGRLRQWHTLGTHLTQHYRAPRIHDWLELEGTPCAGILCDWLEGSAPEILTAPLLDLVNPLLVDLHADRHLARALTRADRTSRTCADTYLETYHDRFVEDLELVGASPPPFVPAERLRWIEQEVALIGERVRNTPEFEEPASAPIHGDFWLNNLLVDGNGRIFVLDWDEMSLGDPVLDWTMLLGPSRPDPLPATARAELKTVQFTPAERARLDVYARASLLDWILDPLADWVAARDEPQQFHAIQPANERVHKLAVANYAALYGTSAGAGNDWSASGDRSA